MEAGKSRISAGSRTILANLAAVVVSVLSVGLFLFFCQLIRSPLLAYTGGALRWQTDAFFHGDFALNRAPIGIMHDLAWANGQLSQVWGLGVPALRMPFEFCARILGLSAFPDRWVFGFYILLVLGQGVLWAMGSRESTTSRFERFYIVFLMVFSVPLVRICRTRFFVYEEVVAYTILYSTALYFSLICFWEAPTRKSYWRLSFLAGLAGFLRPTALAYGGVSLVLAAIKGKKAGWGVKPLMGGLGAWLLGFAMLLWTNQIRFGSWLEFGHRINISRIPDSAYVTRFENPMLSVSWLQSLHELLYALFFRPPLNGADYFRPHFFPGQVNILRFREFYFSVFDETMLIWMLIAAVLACFLLVLRSNKAASLEAKRLTITFIWSLCSTILLTVFYVRYPVITSRYFVDFAPAMAGFLVVATGLMGRDLWGDRWVRLRKGGLFLLITAWWISQWATSEFSPNAESFGAFSKEQALQSIQRHDPRPLKNELVLGDGSSVEGDKLLAERSWDAEILQTLGWSSQTGAVEDCVMILFQNPGRIMIEVQSSGAALIQSDQLKSIRAKVENELLDVESITPLKDRWRIQFKPPVQAAHRFGIQTVYFAFANAEMILRHQQIFKLIRIVNQSD